MLLLPVWLKSGIGVSAAYPTTYQNLYILLFKAQYFKSAYVFLGEVKHSIIHHAIKENMLRFGDILY
jgi:hypothetical protein